MSTLLEKAKELPAPLRVRKWGGIGTEEIELALAWARREITRSQLERVLNIGTASTYNFLSLALAEHIRRSGGS